MLRLLPLLVASLTFAAASSAQIYRVAEMTAPEIAALDRERTVVLLPGGILEQHGPYLPSYSDGFMNERATERIADAIVARPGWSVLVFPVIPLGAGGANEIGGKHVASGTYAVRSSTLRAIFMDLATELGEQGFRWSFIIHIHGAPNHNRMLDQAGDYFRDTYGGRMVHLMGLMPVFASEESGLSEAQKQEDGFSVHAGAGETSTLLFLRPDLVRSSYREAPPQTGRDMDELVTLARRPQWPGYTGSPRLARASDGALGWRAMEATAVRVALQILDGADERSIPRLGDVTRNSPANVAIDRDGLRHDEDVKRRQEAWLRQHGHE